MKRTLNLVPLPIHSDSKGFFRTTFEYVLCILSNAELNYLWRRLRRIMTIISSFKIRPCFVEFKNIVAKTTFLA